MKKNGMKTVIALLCAFFIVSCTVDKRKNVSKDPKYADIYNRGFSVTKPLYLYDYTSYNGKKGVFLSTEKEVKNGVLITTFEPGKAKVLVTKVFEINNSEGGQPTVMVDGKVNDLSTPDVYEYMATWEDIEKGLKKDE